MKEDCPPRLDPAGSVTAKANETATAASIALPPASRMSTPAAAASGVAAATTPPNAGSALFTVVHDGVIPAIPMKRVNAIADGNGQKVDFIAPSSEI